MSYRDYDIGTCGYFEEVHIEISYVTFQWDCLSCPDCSFEFNILIVSELSPILKSSKWCLKFMSLTVLCTERIALLSGSLLLSYWFIFRQFVRLFVFVDAFKALYLSRHFGSEKKMHLTKFLVPYCLRSKFTFVKISTCKTFVKFARNVWSVSVLLSNLAYLRSEACLV